MEPSRVLTLEDIREGIAVARRDSRICPALMVSKVKGFSKTRLRG